MAKLELCGHLKFFQMFKYTLIQFKYQKMSWLCPSVPAQLHAKPLYKTIQYQYRKTDPKTKQILSFICEQEGGNRSGAYEDWRKIKMESAKVKQLVKAFRSNNRNFIDIEFPHHNNSLSLDRFTGEIQWQRVSKVVYNAVYAKQQSSFALQTLNINRKAFANALVLVSKCDPLLFKQLISKTLNQEGIYDFKLFKDGFITNVLVDDYIPVLKGTPVFVGPVRSNEVYPMLIEKAIAKVCGSYQDIPQDPKQILQILLCGPVNRFMIHDLRKEGRLVQKLYYSLGKKEMIVVLSRQDNKIRNYGLNQGEIYQIINNYEIIWSGEQLRGLHQSKISFSNQSQLYKNTTNQTQIAKLKMEESLHKSKAMGKKLSQNQTQVEMVFQCVSQNKISAWNGRYSLNDAVWDKVAVDKKLWIYKQMKDNRSFVISQADIGKHFDQVLILQSSQINSKDWVQNQSHNSFLSYSTFEVNEQDSLFIRVTTRSKLRQTLILVRETSNKKYQFIQSAFSPSTNKIELLADVRPGKYILAVIHQWFVNKSGIYFVFLQSRTHTYLKKGGVADKDFLTKVLFSYEQIRNLHLKQAKEQCSIHLEIGKLGMGYLIMRPENTNNKILNLLIDQNSLKNEGWEVLQPYNGLSEVIVTQKSEQHLKIIVLSKTDLDLSKKNYFPTNSFTIKK